MVATVLLGYQAAIFWSKMPAAKGLAPGKQCEIFAADVFYGFV